MIYEIYQQFMKGYVALSCVKSLLSGILNHSIMN